jgi:hypothetical protein
MEAEDFAIDTPLRWSLIAVAILAVVVALVAAVVSGWRSGLGVLAGGLLATLNLWIFIHIVRGVLVGGRRGRLWILAAVLKLGGLLGGAWLLLWTGICSGAQLAIGYGALPFGIVVGSLVAPRPEDTHDDGAGRDTD